MKPKRKTLGQIAYDAEHLSSSHFEDAQPNVQASYERMAVAVAKGSHSPGRRGITRETKARKMTTEQTLRERIKHAQAEADEKRIAYHNANNQLRALQVEWQAFHFGLSVGMLVKYSGKIYKVVSWPGSSPASVSYDPKPWLKAVMQKKDGSFGTHIKTLYSGWEPVQ